MGISKNRGEVIMRKMYSENIFEVAKTIEKNLPLFKVDIDYTIPNSDKSKATIRTPFEDIAKNKIYVNLVENENYKTVFELSPFSIWEKMRNVDTYYLKELEWRFKVNAGFVKQKASDRTEFDVPYFYKETTIETCIEDLYKVLNAWLYVEGLISRDVFKPVTKEELIDTIVGLIGQGIYDGYVDLAFQGKFPKTEEEIDEEIRQEEEKLYKKLQEKTEEELWQILEEKAKEIIPVINGKVDSSALTAYRDALMLLASKNKFKIDYKGGRRIVGEWID